MAKAVSPGALGVTAGVGGGALTAAQVLGKPSRFPRRSGFSAAGGETALHEEREAAGAPPPCRGPAPTAGGRSIWRMADVAAQRSDRRWELQQRRSRMAECFLQEENFPLGKGASGTFVLRCQKAVQGWTFRAQKGGGILWNGLAGGDRAGQSRCPGQRGVPKPQQLQAA